MVPTHVLQNIHGEAELRCDWHDDYFTTRAPLQWYDNRNSGGQPVFVCDQYGSHYTAEERLQEHVREGHSQPVFECGQCDDRFTTEEELQLHTTTAHIKRKFCCQVCGKRFATEGWLQRHTKRKHGGQILVREAHSQPVLGELQLRLYNCNQCDTSFGTESLRKQHIQSAHVEAILEYKQWRPWEHVPIS